VSINNLDLMRVYVTSLKVTLQTDITYFQNKLSPTTACYLLGRYLVKLIILIQLRCKRNYFSAENRMTVTIIV